MSFLQHLTKRKGKREKNSKITEDGKDILPETVQIKHDKDCVGNCIDSHGNRNDRKGTLLFFLKHCHFFHRWNIYFFFRRYLLPSAGSSSDCSRRSYPNSSSHSKLYKHRHFILPSCLFSFFLLARWNLCNDDPRHIMKSSQVLLPSNGHTSNQFLSSYIFPLKEKNGNRKDENLWALRASPMSLGKFSRELRANDGVIYAAERASLLNESSTDRIPYIYWHADELEGMHMTCRRQKFFYSPTCNNFHELDLSRDYDPDRSQTDHPDFDNYLVSEGFYRNVWVNMKLTDKVKTILKTMRFRHEFNERTLMQVKTEAIVMERLTSAQNIVTGLGHCAGSVMVEAVPYEVEEYVIPGTGYLKQKGFVEPRNLYTPLEKLSMALGMAESIAMLHGFEGGLIVHNDIQLSQWLRARDEKLKLGDFNVARILEWDENQQNYCSFSSGTVFGNVSK